MKKQYVKPKIELFLVGLESGIAAGSATVNPQNSNGQVVEQWTKDDDDIRDLDWGSYN
ncbi:hypothetical protein [uncultured Sphingobacterium sp.]|uniref:hypothetical protein n=1 Tax=uncultured Sphingobacterium sp. TaxID=182688 RepID=UPI0025F4E216|nr:hypothetical protein [uncultured Sphingobacterium sp.]